MWRQILMQPKMGPIVRNILLFSLLVSILFCIHSTPHLFAGAEITNTKAIQIAKKAFEETIQNAKYEEEILGRKTGYKEATLRYNLDQMGIKVSKYYSESNPYIDSEEQIRFKLENIKTSLMKERNELSKLKDENLIKGKEKSIEGWEDMLREWEFTLVIKEILKNKTYWVVHFFPITPLPQNIESVSDGTLNFLINSENGEFLYILMGRQK
jgi:hypothetical protein